MKIFITGGTGFVGSAITTSLLELGHDVTVIGSSSRCRLPAHNHLQYISANTTRPGQWQERVADHEAFINLAGRSVFNLWTEKYKQTIYDSRILTTRNLVEAMPSGNTILLSASAAGYYGHGGDSEKRETAESGDDFLARVCVDWEQEAYKAEAKGSRVATTRFGVVLGRNGGAISTMKLPFKLGLGGPIGSGKQWFPWVHIEDVVKAAQHILLGDSIHGPFNFTAPKTVRQKEFAKTMAAVLNRPALLPTPAFVMKTVLGEFGRSLLQGQKTVPEALETNGFIFSYPELKPALQEILND
ncbi:TIGR01777 family oxidoreductase [Desulfogranum japonicum]|uniref:TIGR01777 family oxidoreductase n=1 Tax=Desulfogranum japonicum TaxID=231447 RepID=UPI00040585C4|nr:TIGR01777 family oxidoreductase [Desulfogranum japonicum]